MNKFYQGVFYPAALKDAYVSAGTWPEHAADVSDDAMAIYSQYPPEGKMLGTDKAGYPVWVDVPPKSKVQYIAEAESKKQSLLAEATDAIAPLQDAVDLDMATDEEMTQLTALKKYRVLLNRVDTSTAPDIEWPEKP